MLAISLKSNQINYSTVQGTRQTDSLLSLRGSSASIEETTTVINMRIQQKIKKLKVFVIIIQIKLIMSNPVISKENACLSNKVITLGIWNCSREKIKEEKLL